jgi:hypothetical protein
VRRQAPLHTSDRDPRHSGGVTHEFLAQAAVAPGGAELAAEVGEDAAGAVGAAIDGSLAGRHGPRSSEMAMHSGLSRA